MSDLIPDPEAALFGRAATPRMVGLEMEGRDRVRVFCREDSAVRSRTVRFEPFLWLASEDGVAGWRGECRVERLEGTGAFRGLASFPDLDALESARSWLQRKGGRRMGAPGSPYLWLRDPVQQYLLRSGETHFLGMSFDRLARMQIDLEVYRTEGFEFPNPRRPGDRITAIAMSDTSGWERLIPGRDHDEGEMLQEMAAEIRRRDPDVIEGHNIFRFDLPYIDERAKRFGVSLRVGRDGSPLRHAPARFRVGDRVIPYRNYAIHGRHVMDTWFLAQRYVRTHRELRRDGLKDVARHFGVAASDRTYIPGEKASWYFDHDPDTLFRYAMDDVRETRAVSAALSPGCYVQARIFPCRYQDTPLTSETTKIDRLMLREYLARRRSVPEPGPAAPAAEKYAALEVQGVSQPVLRCDVTPLYPAVMLADGLFPVQDGLRLFPVLLRGFRDLWERPGPTADAAPAEGAHGFRSTVRAELKALADSFLDYLACPEAHFNDFDAAGRVTRTGEALVRGLAERLEELRARVVTVDAGGVYFVPPAHAAGAAAEEALAAEASSRLPWPVSLPLERYRAMFCVAAGSHALLDHEGGLSVSGPVLSARGLERYRRKWLEEALLLLLQGRKGEVPALYQRYRDAIGDHRLGLSLLARTETLREPLDDYQMKVKGGRQQPRAGYEVALRSERTYLPGDQVSWYVTGQGAGVRVNESCKHVSEWDPAEPDENPDYYKARLHELYEKFRPFLVEDG